MKTAISIPDDIYADAERLARSRGQSRSHLYAEAVKEYLARHDPDTITATLNRVCELVADPNDPLVSTAGRRLLERVE
jgi:metal-responsive CopG/Arc/MetJ family transcriptional regulator